MNKQGNLGFRWHPKARVFDGAGREYFEVSQGVSLPPERPSGRALALGIAAGAFRIGGGAAVPDGFETLTGGSSGVPRRIRRSAASWIASFAVNAGLFGIGPGVRVAVLGRLVHSLALYGAVEGVHLGAEVHLLDDLRPDRQRQALATLGAQVLYATPAQARLLVGVGGDLMGLRQVLIGGAKLDDGLQLGLQSMSPGARVTEFYGAAEASFISLAGPECPEGSVGAAYPGVELRVCGASDEALADGVLGEIWVRSPYLFKGYAKEDPGTAQWRDGFLSVGEMGSLRGGYLYLSGRAGRMVTVADQNVFPEEIEAFLTTLQGVTQAAVLPVPDAARGHHLVAVLMGTADDAAILAALRLRFGSLKSPKRLIWRQDWPMLASGKTDLRHLASDLSQ